ncbi:MAG TPA: transglutaminaseTgpA domain-containing protein [Actinomycetota bacterium]
MAAKQELASRAQRLTSLGAIALLALATSVAFGRVYAGHTAIWKLLAAAAVSLAVAALFERRSLLLATLASAVLLVAAIGLLIFPKTTWYGLPLGETLSAIRAALGRVGEQARVQVAPTPPLAPLMLAGMTAVWTAVFSAHALAVRAGSPLLAILPPVALVGFADTVLEDGARPGYALLFLGAALLVVFLDGLRRIRQWGPIWTWHGRERAVTRATTSGARKVALAAVTVAALAPGILPGFRSGALVDFSTSNGDRVRLDPFVSIKAQLQERTPIDLFKVTSVDDQGDPVPTYWRLYALDRFDGVTWSSSDPRGTRGQVIQSPATFPLFVGADVPTVQQRYQILTDIRDPRLPMAYPPQSLELPLGAVRYNQDLVSAAAPEDLGAGLEYTVTSRQLLPAPDQLNLVAFASPSVYGQYATLPGAVPPEVGQLARQWTRSARTPYEAVYTIQQHLLSPPFTYSLDVKPRADAGALVDFLTKTHKGFCQQFATTMAVMVRELGLPARVVVGFLPGKLSGDTFTVSTEQAHSWVEVLFPGYGWLPFDPTPGRTKPPAPAGSYLNPVASTNGGGGTGTGTESDLGGGQTNTCQSGLPGQLCKSDPVLNDPSRPSRGGPGDLGPLGTGRSPGPSPYRILLWVLAVSAALLLLLFPVVKGMWRRSMVRRVRDPRELVLAAYRVFDGEAADLGLGRGEGETLAEHRDRLVARVRFSDGHLERLTGVASTAAYSGKPVDASASREALRDARVAIRDLRKHAGPVRRILGIYRPGV